MVGASSADPNVTVDRSLASGADSISGKCDGKANAGNARLTLGVNAAGSKSDDASHLSKMILKEKQAARTHKKAAADTGRAPEKPSEPQIQSVNTDTGGISEPGSQETFFDRLKTPETLQHVSISESPAFLPILQNSVASAQPSNPLFLQSSVTLGVTADCPVQLVSDGSLKSAPIGARSCHREQATSSSLGSLSLVDPVFAESSAPSDIVPNISVKSSDVSSPAGDRSDGVFIAENACDPVFEPESGAVKTGPTCLPPLGSSLDPTVTVDSNLQFEPPQSLSRTAGSTPLAASFKPVVTVQREDHSDDSGEDVEFALPPGFAPDKEDMRELRNLMKEGATLVPTEHQKDFLDSVDSAEDGEILEFFQEKFKERSKITIDTNYLVSHNVRCSPRLKKKPAKLRDSPDSSGLKRGFIK